MAKKTIIFDDYEKSNKKKSNKIGKGISSKMIAIIVAAVLVVAIAVTAVIAVITEQSSYLATVNGVKISVNDFDTELSSVVSSYLEKAAEEQDLDKDDPVAVEQFWGSKNEDGVNMRLAAKQEAMQNMVEYAVQLLVAEEKGIVLTQKDKSNLIKEAEANAEYYANYYNQSYGSKYDAESFVEEYYGTNYTDYKKLYMESYILNQLTVMMKAQMTVSDDEIQAWYDKAPETYDLYMVDSIYVSYQKTNDDKKTVMLEGDELTKKQSTVEKISSELTAENFKEYAKDNADATVSSSPLQMTDGKVSLTNSAANMEEVNKWLNETGLKDATTWTKIEVKGASGDFKDKVVGVYFVKFDTKVDINTEDNADATDMRKGIKEEILADNYEKMVEEWAADTAKYVVTYNGDIYKNYNVAGYKAE